MTFLRNLLIILALFVAAVYFGGSRFVAYSLEQWLGVPVSVGRLHWDLTNKRLTVSDVQISNPAGYSDNDMLTIPWFQIKWDTSGLNRGVIRVRLLKLLIDEVLLENPPSNIGLNIYQLRPIQKALGRDPGTKSKFSLPLMLIFKLAMVKIDKIIVSNPPGSTVEKPFSIKSVGLRDIKNSDDIVVRTALIILKDASLPVFVPVETKEPAQQETPIAKVSDSIQVYLAHLRTKINEWTEDFWKAADHYTGRLRRDTEKDYKEANKQF